MSSTDSSTPNFQKIILFVLLGGITLLGFGDSLESGWKWLLGSLVGGLLLGYILRLKRPTLSQTQSIWDHIMVYGIMIFVFISKYLSGDWQLIFQCAPVLLYFCYITIQFPHLLMPFKTYSNLIQLWWLGLISLSVVLNGAFKMILTEIGLTILIYSQIVLTLLFYLQMVRFNFNYMNSVETPQTDGDSSQTEQTLTNKQSLPAGQSISTEQPIQSPLKKFLVFLLKVLTLCWYLPLLAPILYVTEDSRIYFDLRVLLPVPLALILLVVIEEGMFILVGLGLKLMYSKPKLEFGLRHCFSMLAGASIMVGVFILLNLSLDIEFWLMVVGLFAHAILSLFCIFFLGTLCLKLIKKVSIN